MGNERLAVGAKKAASLVALASMPGLTAWLGRGTVSSHGGSLKRTTFFTARKMEVAATLPTAKPNLAAGTHRLLVLSCTEEPRQAAAARPLFAENVARFPRSRGETPASLSKNTHRVTAPRGRRPGAWKTPIANPNRWCNS